MHTSKLYQPSTSEVTPNMFRVLLGVAGESFTDCSLVTYFRRKVTMQWIFYPSPHLGSFRGWRHGRGGHTAADRAIDQIRKKSGEMNSYNISILLSMFDLSNLIISSILPFWCCVAGNLGYQYLIRERLW